MPAVWNGFNILMDTVCPSLYQAKGRKHRSKALPHFVFLKSKHLQAELLLSNRGALAMTSATFCMCAMPVSHLLVVTKEPEPVTPTSPKGNSAFTSHCRCHTLVTSNVSCF